MTEIWHTILISGAFLFVFALAEVVYLKWKVNVEYTRKFIHVSSGLLVLTFPTYIGNLGLVGLICMVFFILLVLSLQFKLLKALNSIDRKSHGAILFPIAVFVLYAIFNVELAPIYFYLPILILSISDTLAALVGKRWPLKPYHIFGGIKSFGGSIAFALSATIISLICLIIWCDFSITIAIIFSLLIGISSACVEAVSFKGLDNLSVPLWVVLILILL